VIGNKVYAIALTYCIDSKTVGEGKNSPGGLRPPWLQAWPGGASWLRGPLTVTQVGYRP